MPHKLETLLNPVPSDIEIAQASDPLPIKQIADELGLLPEELVYIVTTRLKFAFLCATAWKTCQLANTCW